MVRMSLVTAAALSFSSLALADVPEAVDNAAKKASVTASRTAQELSDQTPRQTALIDNGGFFIEAGSQTLKLGDNHTDLPLYGIGADLTGLSWGTSIGLFQLGTNFDVQFMRGKSGGQAVSASTLSAGPTACYWFLAHSSFCLEADVSVMNLKQNTTSHLGAIRGGASLRQRLSDQYMAKISYEGADYSSEGRTVETNNLLLAVSWRPLSAK